MTANFDEALAIVEQSLKPKSLNDLQNSVFRLVWEGKNYQKIAQETGYTKGHIKNVGQQLWTLLSKALGEKVTKSNFKSVLERHKKSLDRPPALPIITPHFEDRESAPEPMAMAPVGPFVDGKQAPDLPNFYGRTEELAALKLQILERRSRLGVIWGMAGIGKTALSVRLMGAIQNQFEYVIWRSLDCPPPLAELLVEIIEFVGGEIPANSFLQEGPEDECCSCSSSLKGGRVAPAISQLIKALRDRRCFLILDNWEAVFCDGKLAGKYREEYGDYGKFLKQIAQLPHQSCLLLTSREKPPEIAPLEGSDRSVFSLKIKGLKDAAKEILKLRGLQEEHLWEDLIKAYKGNPLALNMVVTTIEDLFHGSLNEFLRQDTLFLGDFESLLDEQFDRLSKLEREIMRLLATDEGPTSLSELKEKLGSQIFQSELINIIQSLERRSLLEPVKQNEQTLFALQSVVKKYVSRKGNG